MKIIKLTRGQQTIVDDDVYEWAKNYKWYANKYGKNWYAVRHYTTINNGERKRHTLYLHHCVLGFPLNKLEIDHRDGNGLNNQRDNLHIVTRRKNTLNRVMH